MLSQTLSLALTNAQYRPPITAAFARSITAHCLALLALAAIGQYFLDPVPAWNAREASYVEIEFAPSKPSHCHLTRPSIAADRNHPRPTNQSPTMDHIAHLTPTAPCSWPFHADLLPTNVDDDVPSYSWSLGGVPDSSMDTYMGQMQKKVASRLHFLRPDYDENTEISVGFTIKQNGTVNDVFIEECPPKMRATANRIKEAIIAAQPYGRLPAGRDNLSASLGYCVIDRSPSASGKVASVPTQTQTPPLPVPPDPGESTAASTADWTAESPASLSPPVMVERPWPDTYNDWYHAHPHVSATTPRYRAEVIPALENGYHAVGEPPIIQLPELPRQHFSEPIYTY